MNLQTALQNLTRAINPKRKVMVSFSGGISSFVAAKLWVDRHGPEGVHLVFAETFIEDEDNYRFLIEGACVIYGKPFPDFAYWEIPEIYEDMEERKRVLRQMAQKTMEYLPGFVWLADGRSPWEVMRDVRLIGNSRMDPCSSVLKRKLLDKWRNENLNQATDVCILGINWDESERMDRVRERVKPWNYLSPLIDYRVFMGHKHMREMLDRLGILAPRMYDMGFAHANCGGFCIKAGQGSFRLLHQHFPKRYEYHEGEENSMRGLVGNHSILRDQRKGVKRRLTLEMLRQRIECDQMTEMERMDLGGCACALPL